MHIAPSAPQNWHPETKDERDAVLRELERVLQSPQFSSSKRYPALLRFVVLRALAGDTDTLKERTLGVEVFHRPPTYDTNSDTVVRYTAGEVRKRLFLFYASHHEPAEGEWQVQISLPSGSYVPEFLRVVEPDTGRPEPAYEARVLPTSPAVRQPAPAPLPAPLSATLPGLLPAPAPEPLPARANAPERPPAGIRARRPVWAVLLCVVILAGIASLVWHRTHPPDAVDQFWTPVFRQASHTVVCSGGVVFSQDQFSGTLTAGKNTEYPFVSMQIASAIARVSGVLERGKATVDLQPCTSTPLSALRDHPVVLLGGYNNAWTMRLVAPLRFRFAPEPVYAIQDGDHPQRTWARDRTIAYSDSDDYALVVRFRDSTTGGLVVVLAGLGRNGTEAAAQFATSPAYLQLLRDRVGADLGSKNIEAVLKVHVVDGKTGAPTLQDVYVW